MKNHWIFSDKQYWSTILHYQKNNTKPFSIIKKSSTGRGTLIQRRPQGFGEEVIYYKVL